MNANDGFLLRGGVNYVLLLDMYAHAYTCTDTKSTLYICEEFRDIHFIRWKFGASKLIDTGEK